MIEKWRVMADLSDFTVTGGGESGGTESDAIGSGKRSHCCFERENGRSQRK